MRFVALFINSEKIKNGVVQRFFLDFKSHVIKLKRFINKDIIQNFKSNDKDLEVEFSFFSIFSTNVQLF